MPPMQRVFGLIPSRVKPKTLKLVFAASLLSTQQLGLRAETGSPQVRIMCLGTVACLPADFSSCGLAPYRYVSAICVVQLKYVNLGMLIYMVYAIEVLYLKWPLSNLLWITSLN